MDGAPEAVRRAAPEAAAGRLHALTGRALYRGVEGLAGVALLAMVLIPLVEIAARPLWGRGVENAPVVVQHLGLVLAMAGALAAARSGHLNRLVHRAPGPQDGAREVGLRWYAAALSALVCGALAWSSGQFLVSEMGHPQPLAYGLSSAWVLAVLPLGFAWLGVQVGACGIARPGAALGWALAWTATGGALAALLDGRLPLAWPGAAALLLGLAAGTPIFVALGGLALVLFGAAGLPFASVALSHYQITVNPSLPALPLFTLAGLVLAHTGAARRLSDLFVALLGPGQRSSVVASASLCSAFTATTGGSGVTILALGGLLLPLLRRSGLEERRAIGLVTSASALGVLLAPAVPLIMVAVIARVPIGDIFLAGLIPAALMVVCLLTVGGFLRRSPQPRLGELDLPAPRPAGRLQAARAAVWELLTPFVAIGSLVSGWATPVEGAALTAAYVLATQGLVHRELDRHSAWRCLARCAELMGGVMLILGMALALTNYLIDAGIPDLAIEQVQAVLPNKHAFLAALCLFLFCAAALMEIFAAIVVLVPLLLPVATSYGIDPLHFGILFLAAMEAGFLCPPAGMNLYFASAMFGRSLREVAVAVLPALFAIFVGTLLIALIPALSLSLPRWLGS